MDGVGMNDPLRYPNTDWFDTFMRTGTLQNYTLSATGGNDKSNFYISIGMMDKEGVQMKNDFKRYNTRFNYDYNMFNNVKVGARLVKASRTTIPAIPEVVICNMQLRV